MYNPALEKLRNQAEQRLHQRRMQQLAQWQEQTSMRSLFDPILNKKARERIGGDNWFETTARGYAELFDSNYIEWFRNPGNALINNLTTMGDTLDYAANLIKAPLLAAVKGEDIGTRLEDAYGLGDNGRVAQNMSELREVIGAPASGTLGGTAAGALIGAVAGPLGAAIGAGIGLVVGATAGILGEYNINIGNTITDMALEMAVDPANIAGALSSAKTAANIAKTASGSIDDLAKIGFEQSAKNVDDWIKGTRKGIDSTSFLDHSLHVAAKKSVEIGGENSAKLFKQYKTRLMKSYHEDDFSEFQAVLTEIGMFKIGDSGDAVFDMAKAKYAFDIMKKDAGLSRAYRVMSWFDKFDTNLSKGLLKATPMGISATAFKKGMAVAKSTRATKLLDDVFKAADEVSKIPESEQAEIFKKLDDLGIIYKQESGADPKQALEMYRNLTAKAKEFKASGDEITAAILNKQASKLIFDDGIHKTNIASVKSDLNHLVNIWVKKRGNIKEIIADGSADRAYKNITNLLYYEVGEEVLTDYITKMGYNRDLINAVKNIGNAKNLINAVGASGSSGAHLIIADILTGISKVHLDSDPAKQYIKTIEDIAKKTVSQKEGLQGAEKQLRYSLNSVQKSIMAKYDNLKSIGSVTKELELEYNKALTDVGRHKFDLTLKNYMEPKDYNKLYNARSINKKVQKLRALQNINVEQFMIYNKLVSNTMSEQVAKYQDITSDIIKSQSPTAITQNAQSVLLATIKQYATEALAAINKGEPNINSAAMARFEKDVNKQVQAILEKYELSLDDIEFSSTANTASNAYAAKLYKVFKFLNNQIVTDEATFIKNITTNYKAQLDFIAKHKATEAATITALDNLIFSKTLNDISKYVKGYEPEAKRRLIPALMEYLKTGNNSNNIIDGNLIHMLDNLTGGKLLPKNLIDTINELTTLTKFNLNSRSSLAESFVYIKQAYKAAMNPKQPLDFSIGFLRNANVVIDLNKNATLAKIFKNHFSKHDVSQNILKDLSILLKEYNNLGKLIVNAYESKTMIEIPNYLDAFAKDVDKFINNKWKPYSTYIYLQHHIKDLGVLYDDNFGSALKGFVDNINALAIIPSSEAPKELKAMQRTVILRYSEQLKQLIDNKISFGKNLDSDLYRTLDNPHYFNKFLNDMTTAVKALRTLEYVTKSLQIPNKHTQITEAIRSLDLVSKHLMNAFEFKVNYPKADFMAHVNVSYISDKLSQFGSYLDNVYDSVEAEALKSLDEFRIRSIKVPKQYRDSESASYVKGINILDLISSYKEDAQISESFKFMEVDNKVVKLVTENGVVDLPEGIDIDIDKFIKADLETTLVLNGNPTPEDVVQIAFNTSKGKQNIVVYNPSYNRRGHEELLPESVVNGQDLEAYNPKGFVAFKENKISQASWTVDGNTYTIYKTPELAFNAMYENIKNNIVNINGKNYIAIIGQNSTKFDDPIVLKGLNKYTSANIAGIISEDTLPYIRVFQGLAQVAHLFEKDSLNPQFVMVLNALKDLPNAKLQDVYEALRKNNLVVDITGNAHDASYDIMMTEEILKALHGALGDNFKTIKGVKELLHQYTNGYNKYNSDAIRSSAEALQSSIDKVYKLIDSDYDRRMFDRAVDKYNDVFKNNDFTNVDVLTNLEKYIEDIEYFISRRSEDAIYSDLSEAVDNLKTALSEIEQIRAAALRGVYGDSLVQPKPNSYWVMDYLSSQYHYTRNNEMFLQLYDIFKGEDFDAPDFSLVGLVKRYKQQYGSTESYQMHMEDLTKVYNYTERIDAFVKFNMAINNILSKKLATADETKKDLYLEAFNRIQDKLFGFGSKEENLSFDGWLRRLVSEQKKGYLVNADGDKIKATLKFNQDSDYVKEELKQIITGNHLFSFKNVEDDFKLLDASGEMYNMVLNYINDCVENIGKYNIYNRDGNALTLLKPVADAQYWNQFRNAYNNILDGYKFIEGTATEKEINELAKVHGFEFDKSKSQFRNAEEELSQFMSDARLGLSAVNAEFNRCKSIGLIPEGYLNERYNKNTWEINSSHQKITFGHNTRSKEYYVNASIRDLFYDIMGIKFDPKKNMDVITYKNNESAAIKSIQALRKDSGIYINEIREIINEFNFNNMEYKLPKLKMYSDYYNEIANEAGDAFKPYSDFAETMFKTTFGYLSEAQQKDIMLRQNYEQMFKAIAVSSYISATDNLSVYDTLKVINRRAAEAVGDVKFISAKKALNEMHEQVLNLFKREDGSYDFNAMYYYITNNKNLEFTAVTKSDKYFKNDKALHEIKTIDVQSPEELSRLVQSQTMLSKDINQDFVFSITDKHTLSSIRDNLGQVANNRVYKHDILNKWVEVRKWIAKYIMAPMKTLSLLNIGFTVTNALEGMFKTFISTTGNRMALPRNYGSAIRMHRDWYNLTSEIAKAVQGSMFWSTRDQLKLLEQEELIGKALFSNWEEVVKGAKPVLSKSAIGNLNNSGLPRYIVEKLESVIKNNTLDIQKYADRFTRVHKVYTDELPKYNLDEYKATASFINSPAAAAEFQNIKKSAELNLIGKDKDDNIIEQAMNKMLYSDKWIPGDKNPLRAITPYANLSRNSDIELINRYAMYINTVESGYTKNDALNKVLATHFNYANKSELELSAELLFPFISFPLRNFLYWNEALEEHPELLKVFIDMTLCNWGDEKGNPYNQTKITKGGLRLWNDVSIESGLSVFDAMAFGGNTLNVLTQRKLNPLVGVAIEGAKQLTVGESNLQYRLGRLPIISHVQAGTNLVDSLIKGQPKIYDIAPSLFNEVYKNNRYYYANQGRYAYKSAYNRLYYASGGRRTGINRTRNMVR